MILDVVFVLFSSISIMFYFQKFMRVFFEKSRTPFLVMALSYLLYPVLLTSTFVLLRMPLLNSVIALVSLTIISLNYETSGINRLAAIISIFSISIIVYYAVGFSVGSHHNHIVNFGTIETIDYFAVATVGIVFVLLAQLLQYLKNIKRSNVALPVFWVSALLMPIASLIIAYIIVVIADIPPQIMALALLTIFGADVFIFYLYDSFSAQYVKNLKSALHEQEKKYYLAQCQLMQESTERARSIRHDMKLHLATLKDFALNNKPEDATAYINRLYSDIDEIEIFSKTNHPAIDSVINYKLKDIKKSDTKLNMRFQVPPTLSIDDADIVTIIGNLLDNALEAVAKTEEKTITLNIALDNGTLLIKAENSYNGEINENMASLKSGPEHGYGLNNIKRSVDKYDGYMKITHTENIFSVAIILYVN